jgi:hypothetical protein
VDEYDSYGAKVWGKVCTPKKQYDSHDPKYYDGYKYGYGHGAGEGPKGGPKGGPDYGAKCIASGETGCDPKPDGYAVSWWASNCCDKGEDCIDSYCSAPAAGTPEYN